MATKTIYQNAYLHLVGTLRARRESMSISQTKLAAHLGWPQQRVSMIEAGSRRLDLLEFCRVASALGYSMTEVSELISVAWKAARTTSIK
ncbi:helix-turn-helix transcriptional regulator [Stenotrophomonas terrae]|uniref:helix-turn-helix domain-containing protein n=1 Tax=Stenotrophomonas terrae TaxID=405446 RepID=UPI00320BAEF0